MSNNFSTNQLWSCAFGFWTYESWSWNSKSWSWSWNSKISWSWSWKYESWHKWAHRVVLYHYRIQRESKKSPWGYLNFFIFFHKRLRIFNCFFTHLFYVLIYARLQIFVQLSPTLTKLCHIMRDYLVHPTCAKCPKRAKTRAFRRLRKSLIPLLVVVCGKSL